MLVSLPSPHTRLRQPGAGKEGLATTDRRAARAGARGKQDTHKVTQSPRSSAMLQAQPCQSQQEFSPSSPCVFGSQQRCW